MLELEQAKQRVQELRTVIEKNNRLYYDQVILILLREEVIIQHAK